MKILSKSLIKNFTLKVCILGMLVVAHIQNAYSEQYSMVASVYDMPITEQDIKNRASLIISSAGMPDTQESYLMLHDKVLQMLIDERLIEKESESLKISVSDEDINLAMSSIAERNNVPEKNLSAFLKAQNVDIDEMKRQIRNQILWGKIITQKIRPTVSISPKEIKENKDAVEKISQSSETQHAELRLSEIVLYSGSQEEHKKNMKLAEELVEQVRKGANFGKLAQQFSRGPSAQHFGDIGWVLSSQMQPELAALLLKTEEKQPVVLEVQDGVRIVEVKEKKVLESNAPSKILSDQEVEEYLTMRKMSIALKMYLKKLRAAAHIRVMPK